LAHIWDYISADNPNNAILFLAQIEQRAFSLEILPERHQVITEDAFLHGKYRQLVYKDYRIIYRVQEEIVYIMRIIHSAKLLD
jgi:plasmid stabilization system protein ParE